MERKLFKLKMLEIREPYEFKKEKNVMSII